MVKIERSAPPCRPDAVTRRCFGAAAAAVLFCFAQSVPSAAEAQTPSRCLAIAEAAPRTLPVRYLPAQVAAEEATIRFVGHSTFLITSPDGVTIATDYSGYAGGVTPRVVTMNQAHTSHYTSYPDPEIEYVLRGWDPAGGKAEHYIEVGDVLIRNVTTDIRSFGFDGLSQLAVPDGNSIFIFETARLCIGHLGHLHHELAPEDLAYIGQLDIVMAPVDGSYTIDQASMLDTLKVLKARLVLPMHYFGPPTLNRFLTILGEEFQVEIADDPEIVVSAETLPDAPLVLVLPGY
jgi:L-ascorbate metabolism protein UlaG (beta-lactamase superfamily)